MRNSIYLAIVVSLLSFGLLGMSTVARAASTYQTADMHVPGAGTPLPGAATLIRTENEIWVTISTSGLDKKAGYTAWFVAFNNPDACIDGCDGSDLSIPEVNGSVWYAAGFVTGTDGTGYVTAHATGGEIPVGADVPVGNGLAEDNGFGAEIHMLVRSHGDLISGLVAAQIGSFNGACDVNTCENQQAAVFLPVSP